MIAVVDVMQDIVRVTSDKVSAQIGKPVGYLYGHLPEIDEVLMSYSGTAEYREKKYPAVFLLQDFAESRGVKGVEVEAYLQLLIVAESSATYRAPDRYEMVYKPILYPIYEALMWAINNDPRVVKGYDDIPHDKIDRLRVSGALSEPTKGVRNLFSDHLDAIEIRGLRLRINNYKNCLV